MSPEFTDRAAERCWRLYFARVGRLVSLAGPTASNLTIELQQHLADSFAETEGESEVERLQSAIARLGEPEDYLRPLVADGLIDRATARLNPVGVARALYQAIRLGSARMAVGIGFAVGYLALLVFLAMALLRPLWGGHVGLYRSPDGTVQFGFLRDTTGDADLLGLWTVPAVLVVAALIYLLLTKALRAVWKRL